MPFIFFTSTEWFIFGIYCAFSYRALSIAGQNLTLLLKVCKVCIQTFGHLLDFQLKFECNIYFFQMPPHFHIDFVVSPPGCGRSVIDYWGWGVHMAQLRCLDDGSDAICERGIPGGALPRPWSLWGFYPVRENSHGRTGNRTMDLMVSSQTFWLPSHEAGLTATYSKDILIYKWYTRVPPYSRVIRFKTYRGYVKPRIILNAIYLYNVIFV
jgi:hypothetical protein